MVGRDSFRRARLPVALRRMGVQRIVLVAVVLTVGLTAVFAAALAAYSGQAGDAAVHSALENSSPGSTSILFVGSAPQESAAAATAELQGKLRSALGGVGVTVYAAPELESLALPGSTQAHGRVATLLGAQDLAAHARLVAGSWPRPAGSGDTGSAVPIAINRNTAALLDLHVGDTVQVGMPAGGVNYFTITGVFSPADPQSPYWGLDPLGGAGQQPGTGYTTFGPFYTDPSYLAAGSAVDGGTLAAQQMEWAALPALDQFGTSGLGTLGANLSGLITQLDQDPTLGAPEASTGLPGLLTGLSSAALVARSLVSAELLELLVVAIAALLIVVRLLTETRETEAALLWARGGTGPQLLRLRAVESLLLAAPAVLVAPFTAQPLAAAIGRLGASGGTLAIPSVRGGALVAVWIAVGAAAATAILVILAPALTSAVSPLALRTRRSRQAAVTAVGRAGFDLLLLALAVVACWQLLSKDSIVGTDQSGNATLSPVAIAAPALALAAGAVAVLRLLPLAARLGDLAARRGRSLSVPLAFWQTGRRPLKLAGPVLLTMLAVAAGVLSFSEYASADRSAADQAAFSVGSDADARLSAGLLSPADLAELAGSPGVSAVSPLLRGLFTAGSDASQEATFLAIDPSSAARALIMRPDLSPVPLAALMSKLAGPADRQGDIPAIATEALANLISLKQGSITSIPDGDVTVKVRIVEVVSQFPTITDAEGGLIVDRSTALSSAAAGGSADTSALLAANEVWLRDTSSAAPRGLPTGSTVTYRTQLQNQLRSAPLAEEPMQALLAVAVATVLLALCGMVVGVVSAGGERAGEFALLDALGIARRGRIGLLCAEQLLLAVPGALAGIALGLLLGRIVVPVATLTANAAKPQPPVSVLTPWAPVLLGVLIVLAVPLATAALTGARRPSTAAVLREGADR